MQYQLLALDLDGTVVGRDLEVAAATLEAVTEFQATGGHVTIATGRTFRTTAPFVAQLHIDGGLSADDYRRQA